jgi:hypothetical protein
MLENVFPLCRKCVSSLLRAFNSCCSLSLRWPSLASRCARMASADLQTLASILGNTLHPDGEIRRQAENALASFEKVAGGHTLLLQLITMQEVPFEVRQSASLRLKNLYHGYWSIRKGELAKVSDQDRVMMRANLLESIVRQTDPRLRVQLLEVAYWLWPSDEPDEWKDLIPAIINNIQVGMSPQSGQRPDLMRVYGSICVLHKVLKRYQNREPDARRPVFVIVDACFPLLLTLFQAMVQQSLQDQSFEIMETLRIIVKIFHVTCTIQIPPQWLTHFDAFKPWMDTLLFLFEQPVTDAHVAACAAAKAGTQQDSERQKRAKSPGWRIKKWLAHLCNRIYSRFGRPDHVGQEKTKSTAFKKLTKAKKEEIKVLNQQKKAWASRFQKEYSTKILSDFMNWFKLYSSGHFVHDRLLHQGYAYIALCASESVHYKMLKPALPFLIQECILKTLCLTEEDLIIWRENPQDFVRQLHNMVEEFVDPRMAAFGLLFELVQNRTRDTLQLTLNTITTVFAQYQQAPAGQKNSILKEGAMRVFADLWELMLSKEEFHSPIEQLLIQHVLPEFDNKQVPFLRARACYTVGKYSELLWKNEAAHQQAVTRCVESLRDPEIPVQIEAWEAAADIVQAEKVFKFLEPSFDIFMESFFLLFEEIGSERVASTLKVLIDRFGKSVIPYAVQLVAKLAELFKREMDNWLSSPDEIDEDYAADQPHIACLECIVSVLYAVDSQPQIYSELIRFCDPILSVAIDERCIEFYETTLDMLQVLTWLVPPEVGIPAAMWKHLPRVIQSFGTAEKDGWAADFLGNMVPAFDNYLQRGKNELCSPEGLPMLQGMFNIGRIVLSNNERLIDSHQAAALWEVMMAHLRGRIDPFIPEIVQITGTRLLHIIELEEARERERQERLQKAAMKRAAKGKTPKGKGKGKKGAPARSLDFQDLETEEDENEQDELLVLKFCMLDNIAVACHYNPLLFCQILKSTPEAFQGKLFNVWLTYASTQMGNAWDNAHLAVLGLSSLFLIPLSHLPALWQQAAPSILNELLKLLNEMKRMIDEGDDEPEDSDIINDHGRRQFHDIEEDKDVYHPDDGDREIQLRPRTKGKGFVRVEDDDSSESEDEEEIQEGEGDEDVTKWLAEVEDAMLGQSSKDFKLKTELDEIDAFVFFAQTLETLAKQEAAFYQQWIQAM